MKQLLIAIKATLLLTVLTGLLYPLAVTGLAQILFPHQANGSLMVANGKTVGSELIGQSFTRPDYFHGRPSAAGNGYDGLNSGGSNYGPDQSEAGGPRQRRCQEVPRREPRLHRTAARRSRDGIGQRPRSRTSAPLPPTFRLPG